MQKASGDQDKSLESKDATKKQMNGAPGSSNGKQSKPQPPQPMKQLSQDVLVRAQQLDNILNRRPVSAVPQTVNSPLARIKIIDHSVEKIKKSGDQRKLSEIKSLDDKLNMFMAKARETAEKVHQKQISPSTAQTENGASIGKRRNMPDIERLKLEIQLPAKVRSKLEAAPLTAQPRGMVSHFSSPSAVSSSPTSASASGKKSNSAVPTSSYTSPAKQEPSPKPKNVNNSGLPDFPLNCAWRFFYDRRGLTSRGEVHGKNFENNLIPLPGFDSIKSFWRIFNNLKLPSSVEINGNLHLFKEGIKPMWEDPANENGGKWTITFPADVLPDDPWFELVLACVGECMDDNDGICGVVYSRRVRGDRISIWMRDYSNPELLFQVGKAILVKLNLYDADVQLDFTRHSDSLKQGTSYNTASLNDKIHLSLKNLRQAVKEGYETRRQSIQASGKESLVIMTNSTKPQSSDFVLKFHDTLAAALDDAPKSQKKDYDVLLNEFEAWATKNGIVMDGLRCSRRDNMNCLTATREIQPDEVVLEVPRAAMITEEDAFESTLGKLLSQDQLVSSSPQLVLSLFVLYVKIAGDSKWEPYFALLPETFSTPFYFSQEALNILKGTLIYEEVQSRMKTILAQYDYVCNLLKPWMSTFFVNYTKGNDGLSFSDFLWALSITMTRQNSIPNSSGDGSMLALVPVWDFCNHMNGPIKTYYETTSDSLQHYAGKSFENGKEFTMSYGQRSNSELLIYSGFIDRENTNNYVNMILSLPPKDPLFEIKRNFLSNLNIPSTDQGIKLRLYQPLEHSQNEIMFMVIKIMVMEESDLKQAIVNNEIETLKLSHTTKAQAEKISQWLKIKLQVILKLYPSSDETDQKMLKEDSNSADKLLALQYRLLERDLISKLMHELQDRGISDAIKAF